MKNKGFTLVEMLAVLVILGLLIGIGVFTVNNIKDNAEKNYYVSMEDTLKIAGMIISMIIGKIAQLMTITLYHLKRLKIMSILMY